MKKLISICASISLMPQLSLFSVSCSNPFSVEEDLRVFFTKTMEKITLSASNTKDFNNVSAKNIPNKLDQWMVNELVPANYSGYKITTDKKTKPSTTIFLASYKIKGDLIDPLTSFECEFDIFIGLNDSWQSLYKLTEYSNVNLIKFYTD
ncbi:hypothetical protein SLITO_v1c10740 [Spiroplasma litorale]|uniref:Lipoprotein n=1 Tax=Spiroplasma litorale TaxID=216942 RepID=A0A0K1W2Y3_9MOLU|nr:hypothetical protein [Spiroplasma litorale]AKX34685.1 hypothetical protein SLITO_v1c10740 [Spiroplasma litorale]